MYTLGYNNNLLFICGMNSKKPWSVNLYISFTPHMRFFIFERENKRIACEHSPGACICAQ